MSSQLQVSGEAKIRDIQGPVVANSGVITALDGAASQYVRGDGTLADFPTSTGGGSSVSYYLNSSVSQGTIGGVAYRELSKEPIIGAGTDITISANGYVASYITDANDPDVLSVPGGNFNCEFYFSVNNNTGNPTTYAELYKYDGTTFTLLGTSAGVPESINQGTTIAPYYFAIPVATAALALTDRLAIRIYVSVDGRVVTLHTENSHLCQVVTTFSKGMVSLNNLTDQSQFITTGTSGTDFNIVSSGDTHTFNIPSASASNRGLITTGTQTIAGLKTFNDAITGNSGIAFLNGVMPPITSSFYSGIGGNSQGISIVTRPVSTNYTNNIYFPSASNSYTFPNATGTLALTSDISYPVSSVFGRTGAVVAQSGDYTTTQVTEGTNLYFTDARSRAALSFVAGSGAYNSSTGVITIPTNNNQITNGAGYITSSALSGYLPLTGGTLTGGLNGTTATFSGLGTFYQLTMTGATAGRIFYAQTGGVISQSGNLNWNETNGMLGVGTPNPTAVITAFSNNAATQFKASGNAPAFTFSESLTTSTRACVFGLATAANQFITGTAAGDMAIANQSTTAGAIIFGTGTAEKMRMSSSGNFGIGTSSPSYTFDVNKTINGDFIARILNTSSTGFGLYVQTNDNTKPAIRIANASGGTAIDLLGSGAATFSSSVTANYGGTFIIPSESPVSGNVALTAKTSNGNNDIFRWYDGATQLGVFKNSGNVGIGTSSPVDYTNYRSLHIMGASSTSSAILYLTNSTSSIRGLFFAEGSASRVTIGSQSNHDFTFVTNDTERMRITSGGNLLVGTTTDVGYKAQFVGGGSYTMYINQSGGTATYIPLAINHNVTSGTIRLINFSVGGTTDVGSITTNGSVTSYNVTSDYRLKQDLKDFNGLSLISKIKTYDYEWKSDKSRMYGVVAHELQSVLPYAVAGEKDAEEMQGVDYSKLVPILVKAIQEQQAQIEELKALIAAK